MKSLVEYYCELPQSIRPALWRIWHDVLNLLDAEYSKVFLNYGYASLEGAGNSIALSARQEPDRYGIQLYHHVTKGASWENASVLEVGCGRGGGASFLAQFHRPKEYLALDIAERLIGFCNRFHRVPGLRFVRGSATRLPFEANRFDAVVNIESARCYGNIGAFFREVHRVLKPGGQFFFADMIKKRDVYDLQTQLKRSGFDIVHQQNIRENVVRALQLDAAARKRIIQERVPAWLRPAFYEFAGVEGSKRFRAFFFNEMQYRSYLLQKTEDES